MGSWLLADVVAPWSVRGRGLVPERKKRNHIRELEALGYKVTLQPAA